MKYIKTLGVFILALTGSYIVLIFFVVYFLTQSTLLKAVWPLETYIRYHREELQQSIFNKTFTLAKGCESISDLTKRKECEVNIGRKLGGYLVDEELGGSKYGLPQLFFLKIQNGKFETLDWSGKIVTGSVGLSERWLLDNRFVNIKALLGKCNFFSQMPNYLLCEVFAPINLPEGAQGYLGWKMYYSYGGDFHVWPFYLIYVTLLAPMLFISAVSGSYQHMAVWEWIVATTGFVLSISPWFIACFMAWKYDSRGGQKRR